MSKLPQHIDELFDKKFVQHGGVMPRHRDYGQTLARELKSFIATILEEEKERVIKEIELLKVEVIDDNGCTGTITSGWCCPKHKLTDNTLDTVINLIKEDE